MNKRRNLTGQQFNRLTVKEFVDYDRFGSARWLCNCICGNSKIVSSPLLLKKSTMSCGCLRKEIDYNPPSESGLTSVMCDYKCRAKQQKISFSLTRDDFRRLTSSNCHYCGDEPSRFRSNGGLCKETKTLTAYKFNGIDRIDSNKGYDLNNVVPCCKICNYAKGSMTVAEFKAWIKKAHNYLCL